MLRVSSSTVVALLAALVLILTAAPGIGRWYERLSRPREVKSAPGTTEWAPPAGTVHSLADARDLPMTRSDAGSLLSSPVAADAASIERGDLAYHSYCAACHGLEGRGDGPMAPRLSVPPPNLFENLWRRSDGYLYATIRDGGPIMPSQRERISLHERWDIVNYLRSIADPEPQPSQIPAAAPVTEAGPGADTSRAAAAAAGDSGRGSAVFEGHCQVCHVADSAEELVGPGLQGLFQWPAHTLSDGTEHATHTPDIVRRQIVEGGGSMAPVGAQLSDEEIADLIAYLQTL